MKRIAIIGAGIAGLTLARALSGVADVTVFEKSRGVSGRLATRTAAPFAFDHGAQYFTARSDGFLSALAPHIDAGTVGVWEGIQAILAPQTSMRTVERPEPVYVGVPSMTALCKALAQGLNVVPGAEVSGLHDEDGAWRIGMRDGTVHAPFDWVVSSAPAIQTARLMPDAFSGHDILSRVRMVGCFTLMAGLDRRIDIGFDGAKVRDSILGWIAVNGSKPGRPEATSIVMHSANDWAEAHIEDDPEHVKRVMLAEFASLTGHNLSEASHLALHRWRYADTVTPAGVDCLIDSESRLAACGDWCIAGRVEAAFTSASRLADALKDALVV